MTGGVVGIGTDLVDLDRFREVLARRPGMVERLFTEGEREYAERRGDPLERYAVRFAAKEAVMKALGVGIGAVGWHDIEVERDDDGVRRCGSTAGPPSSPPTPGSPTGSSR